MTKSKRFFLSFLFFAFSSSQAYSLIHGGLSGGYRGAMGEHVGSTPEIRAFLHFNPIPLIPASVGFSYAYMAPVDVPNKKIQVGEMALELAAWLPISAFPVTPYVRARAPFFTFFMGKHAKGMASKAFTGFHGNLGARWSFLPMFALFLEGGIGFNSYELDTEKVGTFYNVLGGLQVEL